MIEISGRLDGRTLTGESCRGGDDVISWLPREYSLTVYMTDVQYTQKLITFLNQHGQIKTRSEQNIFFKNKYLSSFVFFVILTER